MGGTESRMSDKNAEVVRAHPAMRYGTQSPGALEYSPNDDKVSTTAPQYSFGPEAAPQTSGKVMPRIAFHHNTPRTVGPGSNSLPGAIGCQPSSARSTAP